MDVQQNRDRVFPIDLYRSFLEASDKIALRMTPDGRILYINPFGLRFFGYSEVELIGQKLSDTLLPFRKPDEPLYEDLPPASPRIPPGTFIT